MHIFYQLEYISYNDIKYHENGEVLMNNDVDINCETQQEMRSIFQYLLDREMITEEEYRRAIAKIRTKWGKQNEGGVLL